VAFIAEIRNEGHLVYIILNAYWEPLDFELPPVGSGGAQRWRRWIDTALDSPLDIVPWQSAPSIPGFTYRAESRSVVVMYAELK
jgi:glycogen operon protein